MKKIVAIVIIGLVFGSVGCSKKTVYMDTGPDKNGFSAPTQFTGETNAKVLNDLPFSDNTDFIQANRGLIARDEQLRVRGENGTVIWDQTAYDFIKGDSPSSVNPSLWRQAQLNSIHGLFKVSKGIYQVRGYDFANMTIIEGKSGWILVDPLTSKESAAKAIAFARTHLGRKPITAIIFTHSHVDHFGGVLGIMSAGEAKKNNVRIVAPQGFMKEATSENILAGPTMIRRADFMYGKNLPRTDRGHVDSGLGKGPAYGKIGILPPTDIVNKPTQEMIIDGIKFIFQNVPGSEAPAELIFYLPESNAFCGAEIVTRQMHNLYTLRGAKIRDALAWSNYIEQARVSFPESEIYFGSHHWPIWGNQKINDFLKKQRDTYKYIHDQTLRMAHSGYTPKEIAENMVMPEALRTCFSSRGYYGTVRHNSRAVYQAYFGWFDGNPANLNTLPPVESANRYVKFMGGAENVMAQAQASYDTGDYRWVAEVLNHLVFAEPENKTAKELLAKTYDQLGYQAESGPWRDVYLTGASELRHGSPQKGICLADAKEMLKHTSIDSFLDSMSLRLNGPDADGKDITLNFTFTDLNVNYVITVENAVMHYKKSEPDPKADATLKLTHDIYLDIALEIAGLKDILFSDDIKFEGSKLKLIKFFSLLDKPDPRFNIVVP
ncbi:MAG: MBL fold metallo-hydrolase [Desulfobacterium sp.]|nr:MBL fold metallo-hydrolase [Desulfobacterium sp.]